MSPSTGCRSTGSSYSPVSLSSRSRPRSRTYLFLPRPFGRPAGSGGLAHRRRHRRHPGTRRRGGANRHRSDMDRVRSGLSSPDEPVDRPRHEALRRDPGPRRARVRGRAGRGVRLPRRERRRQDDDDADLPRDRPGRRRRDPLERTADSRAAATDVGLPARGARPVPADDRARPARLLRLAVRRAARPRAARRAIAWLARFRIPEYADRRAEELSKGNQQKVQFIAAVLHDPEVLLMDEPFTGLDPVNLILLREAFMELRDRGRTLIFSTHQMEAAEALCELVAIVDHGRLVAGGRVRDLKRASGRRTVRIAIESTLAPAWLADLPGVDGVRPTPTAPSSSSSPAPTPPRSSPPCLSAARRSRRFEVAEPSLEALFIEHVGRPSAEEGLAPERRRAPGHGSRRRSLMAKRDPLLPNAAIVARREFRDRVRSPLYIGSTIVLMGLALIVALAPIAIRYIDRTTVTRIAVVAGTGLAASAVSAVDTLLNSLPPPVRHRAGPSRLRSNRHPIEAPKKASGAGPWAGSCLSTGNRTAGSTSRSGPTASRTRSVRSSSVSRRSPSRSTTGRPASPTTPAVAPSSPRRSGSIRSMWRPTEASPSMPSRPPVGPSSASCSSCSSSSRS